MGLFNYSKFCKILEKFNFEDLNKDFLSKAKRSSGFSLQESDFKTDKHKKEIQYLISTEWFETDALDFLPSFDMDSMNAFRKTLIEKNAQRYFDLYRFKVGGMGPAEALLYFSIDDSTMGGGESAGVDLRSGGSTYEVKAVVYRAYDKSVGNFRTGGTVKGKAMDDIRNEITTLALKIDPKADPDGGAITGTTIKDIINKQKMEWDAVEKKYAELVYNEYFSKELFIFINNDVQKGGRPGPKLGEILFSGSVTKDMIKISHITEGVIRPMIMIG
jgi:hypothetical protein